MDAITYYSDVGPLKDSILYAKAYGKVSPGRREKTDLFVFDKDRRLSLGVELLLMVALEDIGENTEDLDIIYGSNGKPFLRGSDICFNLSHSGEHVMCSVYEQDTGCDVEMIAPIDLNIARNYFHGSEYDRICRCEGEEMFKTFYRLWTLKESFMKATGMGFRLGLGEFRITLGEDITVEQNVDSRDYRFKEYTMDDGYCYSVCSVNGKFEPQMRKVELDNLF